MTNFLLIEDDDIDFWAVQRAFKRMGVTGGLHRVTDALEALDLFSNHTSDPEYFTSLVIILDINLPCMNGFDFLERISSRDELANVPVIITTTSEADKDRQLAAEHNVTDYVEKANLVSGLEQAFARLGVCMGSDMQSKLSPNPPVVWQTKHNPSAVLETALG